MLDKKTRFSEITFWVAEGPKVNILRAGGALDFVSQKGRASGITDARNE